MDVGNIPSKFGGESLSLDGALHWVNELLGPDAAALISFDPNQEQFQLVKPPQNIASNLLESPELKLVEFRGRVAILVPCVRSDHFVLHVLEDNEGYSWIRHVFPSPMVRRFFASNNTIPVGNLPTGQLKFVNTGLGAKVLGSWHQF